MLKVDVVKLVGEMALRKSKCISYRMFMFHVMSVVVDAIIVKLWK